MKLNGDVVKRMAKDDEKHRDTYNLPMAIIVWLRDGKQKELLIARTAHVVRARRKVGFRTKMCPCVRPSSEWVLLLCN